MVLYDILSFVFNRKQYMLIAVPLKINNLADGSRPNGSDYKPTPSASSHKSDAFDCIYDSVK
jgi:hypothetical protein